MSKFDPPSRRVYDVDNLYGTLDNPAPDVKKHVKPEPVLYPQIRMDEEKSSGPIGPRNYVEVSWADHWKKLDGWRHVQGKEDMWARAKVAGKDVHKAYQATSNAERLKRNTPNPDVLAENARIAMAKKTANLAKVAVKNMLERHPGWGDESGNSTEWRTWGNMSEMSFGRVALNYLKKKFPEENFENDEVYKIIQNIYKGLTIGMSDLGERLNVMENAVRAGGPVTELSQDIRAMVQLRNAWAQSAHESWVTRVKHNGQLDQMIQLERNPPPGATTADMEILRINMELMRNIITQLSMTSDTFREAYILAKKKLADHGEDGEKWAYDIWEYNHNPKLQQLSKDNGSIESTLRQVRSGAIEGNVPMPPPQSVPMFNAEATRYFADQFNAMMGGAILDKTAAPELPAELKAQGPEDVEKWLSWHIPFAGRVIQMSRS